MRQLCKHGIDHDHACQQCDLASLPGFGAPAAAPDVEARLSELQLGEIRDVLAGDKRGWYPWAARKLLRELDAAQKEIAELRGELVGTKGMLDKADATVALYGRWLEEREEQLTGAERRGFAQGAEKIARALQFAGPSPAELQPPPEGTISPDETSDFGATPEDGYRNGFREGVKRTEDEAWSWRKAAEDAQIQLEALRGELRSLKGKPAGASGRGGWRVDERARLDPVPSKASEGGQEGPTARGTLRPSREVVSTVRTQKTVPRPSRGRS